MKLIVGLGNPGSKYQGTLHNIGADLLDLLAGQHFNSTWNKGFKGLYLKENQLDETVVLLKPMTFMNLSGESVLACRSFYKIEVTQVLVVSDDVDLSPGVVRFRKTGGHGGHNGLRSIIEHNGNSFNRLRMGIGRPDQGRQVSNYVLSKVAGTAGELLTKNRQLVVDYIMDFIQNKPVQIDNG